MDNVKAREVFTKRIHANSQLRSEQSRVMEACLGMPWVGATLTRLRGQIKLVVLSNPWGGAEMLSLDTTLETASAVTRQSLGADQDIVILSLDSGYLYTANATTEAFLAALDGRRTIRQVAELLAEEFDVPLERLHRDLVALAGRLLEEQLVVPVEP